MKLLDYFRLHTFMPFRMSSREMRIVFSIIVRAFLRCKKRDRFHRIEIEVISACNRTCSYCPAAHNKRKPAMIKDDVLDRILSELRSMKFNGLIVLAFYGEPLLVPHLSTIAERVKTQLPEVTLQIFTNGDKLDEAMADALISAGTDYISVSDHGNLNPAIPFGKYPNKIYSVRYGEDAILSNRGGAVKVKRRKQFSKCIEPSVSCVINLSGDVILCCNDFFGKNVFGNIMGEPLQNIWHKDEFRKLRKELRNGAFNLEICRRCVGDD